MARRSAAVALLIAAISPSVLWISLAAFAKSLRIGKGRLGIDAGVVEAPGTKQRQSDVVAGLTGAKCVAGFLFVTNGLLVMLQCAGDLARLVIDVADLIVRNSTIGDGGLR